jgi:citrate lyase subunit beta/citryl-CoA lyase
MTEFPAPSIADAQTFLFVPADRPERFTKAHAAGADVVVLDLEDAVSSTDKDAARRHAEQWLQSGRPAMVRINAAGSNWHRDDVAMVTAMGASVMLPKSERRGPITRILEANDKCLVVLLIETAAGIGAVTDLATMPGVARIAFGSIDLATEIGIDPTDRDALLCARSTLIIASAAAGLPSPIDGVTMSFKEPDVVADDTKYARRLGMRAKLCIHPAQLAPVRAALMPSAQELEWAKRILSAAAETGSAVAVDGTMVDAPVVQRAHQIISASAPR